MTPAEVAALHRVAESTVRLACASGRLRAQRVGSRWVIARADAMPWRPLPSGWPKGRARGSG